MTTAPESPDGELRAIETNTPAPDQGTDPHRETARPGQPAEATTPTQGLNRSWDDEQVAP